MAIFNKPSAGNNMNNITFPLKKNVTDPVTLLLRNALLPNIFPKTAANESAKVRISAAGTAVLFSKIIKITVKDTNKYVAPVIFFAFSSSLNK